MCHSFSKELLKPESLNLVNIWTMSYSIVGLKIGLIAIFSTLYLSTFLSFQGKFVSEFSEELCKLGSSVLSGCKYGGWVIVSWD